MKRSRGFTILEMLLAVTLFSIVMAASYSIFSMGIQIWRRTQGVDVVERKALLALEKIARDMRLTLRTVDENLELGGNTSEVTLPGMVTSYDKESNPVPHYGRFTYKWEASSRSICKIEESLSDLFRGEKSSACRTVASYISRFRMQYWIYDGVGDSYSWYDRWQPKDGLPQAVRITMEFDPLIKTSMGSKLIEKTILIPVGGKETKPGAQTIESSVITPTPAPGTVPPGLPPPPPPVPGP